MAQGAANDEQLSMLSSGVVLEADQARQAIADRDEKSALEHTSQSLSLALELEKAAPGNAQCPKPGALPEVAAALSHLRLAQNALRQGKFDEADTELEKVQRTKNRNASYAQAQEQLTHAQEQVRTGKYKEAEASLLSASRALDDADAEVLKAQIESHAQSVRHNHANSLARIGAWLEEVGARMACGTPSSIIGGMK